MSSFYEIQVHQNSKIVTNVSALKWYTYQKEPMKTKWFVVFTLCLLLLLQRFFILYTIPFQQSKYLFLVIHTHTQQDSKWQITKLVIHFGCLKNSSSSSEEIMFQQNNSEFAFGIQKPTNCGFFSLTILFLKRVY